MNRAPLLALIGLALLPLPFAAPAHAQGHDITQVDAVPPGASAATPLPIPQRRRLKRYEIPELAGAKQALGSQLIDGRLPKPLLDYLSVDGAVEQRISFFEGGLVVVRMEGAGGLIRKKVILPADAIKQYLLHATPEALRQVDERALATPMPKRRALLRIYQPDGGFVERQFQPGGVVPKPLHDQLLPLQDLLRAISEDRTVTSTVAGYDPKPGDELVADDERVYRVMRVVEPSGVVELKCMSDPTTIFVARKDLAEYFVGKAH